MVRYRWSHKFLAVAFGAVALFESAQARAEWVEVATLTRPTDLGGDGKTFATRGIACGGGTVLVGANGEDEYAGAVYSFSGPGYAEMQRLTAPVEDKKTYMLGSTLAVSGDTAIVGSSQIDDGYVRFFTRQGGVWTHQQLVFGSGDAKYGAFGNKVAIRGDLAVVTSPKEAGDLGRIHVFRRDAGTWSEEAVLAASDGMMSDFFGLGFDFDGDTLIAGAPTNPLDDSARGAAFIFRRAAGAWSQEARFDLVGQDPTTPAIYFGGSASIDGDWAVVSGSAGTDVPVEPRVYVYQRTAGTWQQSQVIVLASGESLGASAVVQGDRLFIQSTSGLHVYARSGSEWALTQTLPALAATSSAFAVCGGTLVRTNDPTIVVYQDPSFAGTDPNTPPGGTADPSGGGAAEKESGGCSYRRVPAGGAGTSLLGTFLLLLAALPRLRRRAPSPAQPRALARS
jgi:hypothetical protein